MATDGKPAPAAARNDLTGALGAWRAAGERYTHRGHAIFFRRDGRAAHEPTAAASGDVLVCIHGFPTSSFDWHKLWPRLSARFSLVLACNLIGYGWSDKPADHAYSILDQADLIDGWLSSLGVGRHHLLAHDYGDTVAQELLARQLDAGPVGASAGRPAIVSACLLNGGLFPETHRATLRQRLLASPLGPLLARRIGRRGLGRSFAAIFGAHTQPSEAELDALWSIVRHADGKLRLPRLLGYMAERRRHRARWVGALQRTQVPLRVIDGAADPVSGAHMVARYRALVPDPDCVELPGIGHYPQLEAPDAVWDAYDSFLSRVGTCPAPG